MITLRFITNIILLILAFIFNHLGRWPFLQTVILFLLFMPLIAWVSGKILKSRVRFSLRTEAELVERGAVARWLINLENTSYIFSLFCQARLRSTNYQLDETSLNRDFILPRRGQREIGFEHLAAHCGPLDLVDLELWLKDPFGFFWFQVTDSKLLENLDKIYVLPQKMPLLTEATETEFSLEEGAFLAKKSIYELDEIDRMREMQPGDRLKSIHWKLSARVQDWMVKQYEKAEERQVLFLFDLPKIMPDQALSKTEFDLELRDNMLEHMTSLLERFLIKSFIVKLRLPGVNPAEFTATKLIEFDYLRQALAKIPLLAADVLDLQIQDELLNPEKRLYYLATHHLQPSTVGLISLLHKENAGCVIAYYIDQGLSQDQAQLLSELAQSEVKIMLFNRYGEEVFDESIQA